MSSHFHLGFLIRTINSTKFYAFRICIRILVVNQSCWMALLWIWLNIIIINLFSHLILGWLLFDSFDGLTLINCCNSLILKSTITRYIIILSKLTLWWLLTIQLRSSSTFCHIILYLGQLRPSNTFNTVSYCLFILGFFKLINNFFLWRTKQIWNLNYICFVQSYLTTVFFVVLLLHVV